MCLCVASIVYIADKFNGLTKNPTLFYSFSVASTATHRCLSVKMVCTLCRKCAGDKYKVTITEIV